MDARNVHIKLYGMPEADHWCTKCVRIYPGDPSSNEPAKRVAAVVIDGVTVGRPTCGEPRCTNALPTPRHRFCPTHDELNHICSVFGCSRPTVSKKRTCNDAIHAAAEALYVERGQAQFQMKERLARARVAHPNNSTPLDADLAEINEREGIRLPGEEDNGAAEAVEEDEEQIDTMEQEYEISAPTTGSSMPRIVPMHENTIDHQGLINPPSSSASEPKKKIRAQFGRKRTHNEQIIVHPCGIIAARETFYHAEAIPSVVEFSG
ncbi:hypothetical protein HGRIS_011211 [Hohenbuehelia grisea]|uniref:CxC6 like cysteine cluster associated with KDZ domain-containing protein n=1 Tax=Hohenbuehelia grisea TaxID=104357 RepID=A0ABR3JWL6_9AGAR